MVCVRQVDRREAWSTSQESCQRPSRDPTGTRWQQCAAAVSSLPADIPYVFRHWSADVTCPAEQYMLYYRSEYTYRRLGGVQRGGAHASTSSNSCSDCRPTRRDASDAVAASQRAQSDPAVKSVGRAGHRSAPASFGHGDGGQQRGGRVVLHDDDNVTITTVSLQLPSPLTAAADHQIPTSKSFLRCPAIRIHLNTSSSSSSAPQSVVTLQAPTSLPPTTNTGHCSNKRL